MFAEIKDKPFFGKTANVVFVNILSYDLKDDKCVARFELRYRNPERESPAIVDDFITTGVWNVPSDVLNSWRGSNEFMFESFCNEHQLEFVKILQT